MGLFSLCFGGGSLMLIGFWEAISSSYTLFNTNTNCSQSPPNHISSSSSSSSTTITTTPKSRRPNSKSRPPFSTITLISTTTLSLLTIIDSIYSSLDAVRLHDRIGTAFPLLLASSSSLFLIFSVSSLLLLPLPTPFLHLLLLSAFSVEFLLFSIPPEFASSSSSAATAETHYFSLLLVPISACLLSSLFHLRSPSSPLPRLARSAALLLHGSWLIQIAFSLFSPSSVTHGCSLHHISRPNYTLSCSSHQSSHRSLAVATLQFNCHLAGLVLVSVGFYAFLCHIYSSPHNSMLGGDENYRNYRPLEMETLSAEGNGTSVASRFSLHSDEEVDEEIVVREMERRSPSAKSHVPISGMNGFGNH